MLGFKKNICSILVLCWAVLLYGCSVNGQRVIVENVSAKETAQITQILYEMGINTTVDKITDTSFRIKVGSGDYIQANKALLNIGIYRDDTGAQMMKIVSKGSMVETPLEQQFRFNQLISQTLSSTLSNLDYVVFANVYISNQLTSSDTNVNLMQDNQQPTIKASIYLKVSGLPTGSRGALINSVKKIVAGAVVNLDVNDIYVVIENV